MSTGLRKKLLALASKKVAYNTLRLWVPAIIDHFYYVVKHTTGGQLRIDWWSSAINHVCNVHVHDSEVFPKCQHGELDERMIMSDGKEKKRLWLDRCRLLTAKVTAIINTL